MSKENFTDLIDEALMDQNVRQELKSKIHNGFGELHL